jgi:hypothetical protein
MDTVYKFCGKHGLTTLCNLELLVRPPNQFNDPFEFTPKVVYSDQVLYAKRVLALDPVREWLHQLYLKSNFRGTFDEYQKLSGKVLAEAPEHTSPLFETELLNEVSKLFGVLCLSTRRDSILMWGHYCDKSSGLVIGFDKSSGIFQQEKGLRPVDYLKERVVFDACWKNGTPEMDSYNHKLIFSKSDAWIYEQELRQFFWLSKLKPKPLDNGTLGHFLSFPAEAVVSVTLGPRCLPEFEKDVQETVLKPPFFDVKLDRAVLNKDNFTIEFKPVELT